MEYIIQKNTLQSLRSGSISVWLSSLVLVQYAESNIRYEIELFAMDGSMKC